ncbi:hypothetical protein N566_04520 [Streptomycetaceae bacterium MP113-05]|nr:hypothetical protein N566_04520 [Streptomycetaceae bacterium MP113-05]
MRKIRTAAAVVTLAAGLGIAGAGTAVASHGPSPVVEFGQENGALCAQSVEQTSNSLIGDINVGVGVGVLGEGEGEASSDRSVELECEVGQENEID